MKKFKVRNLILILTIIGVICCISNINYATTGDVNSLIQNITQLPSNNEGQSNNINDANNTVQNITSITNTNTNTKTNTSNNTNRTTNTTLPKTGVNDTIMWVLIGVSAVAAIYTYKKVRDYNV